MRKLYCRIGTNGYCHSHTYSFSQVGFRSSIRIVCVIADWPCPEFSPTVLLYNELIYARYPLLL